MIEKPPVPNEGQPAKETSEQRRARMKAERDAMLEAQQARIKEMFDKNRADQANAQAKRKEDRDALEKEIAENEDKLRKNRDLLDKF